MRRALDLKVVEIFSLRMRDIWVIIVVTAANRAVITRNVEW